METNKFVYNNNWAPTPPSSLSNRYVYVKQPQLGCKTILVNPHFSKKVFVNPNFNRNCHIHINPLIKPSTIHINPKFQSVPVLEKPLVLTSTKLIRNRPVRRKPIRSRFKLVKTSPKQSPLIRSKTTQYKIDRRVKRLIDTPKKGSVSRKMLLSIVNISGVKYKTSRTTLRRADQVGTTGLTTVRHGSPFKVLKKSTSKKTRQLPSARKLKKCNIPCRQYQKVGYCKLHNMGKCGLKHDPNQIALCTKFLQGACLKTPCLLSHSVSPEKMPTCKYFLEGSCSRENCPYLHVKISSKADICLDFLKGFCKKAAECNKRHQYLCPEFEKHGDCRKQRCQYPHGKLVRNYLMNKKIFVKEPPLRVVEGTKKPEQNRRYYVEDDEITEKEFNRFKSLDTRPKLGSLPSFISFSEC